MNSESESNCYILWDLYDEDIEKIPDLKFDTLLDQKVRSDILMEIFDIECANYTVELMDNMIWWK